MNNSTILDLNNRQFDKCLLSIIVIPIKAYFKENAITSSQKELYLFFSCNIHGKRKYLTTVFKDDFTKVSDWYDFILSLKDRGINIILYALIPNNEHLSRALKLVFNEMNVFISYLETITKLSKYYTSSYTNSLFEKVKKVYLSKNIDDYNMQLDNLNSDYLELPFIYELLEDDIKRAKQYCNIDYELRRFIFSFYFCRDLYKRLLVISHSKTPFTSIDNFIDLLIPDIQRIEVRVFCPKKEINYVINKIYTEKKDLIKSYL